MPVIETKLDIRDATFAKNRDAMAALVADLRAQVARVEQGGGEAACAKHVARGKLLPRERVRALLDPGSPFLELSQLAAHGMYDGTIAAAGIITGRRSRGRPRMRHRLQRRDGQGRHVLPADRQEAPAGAGDRPREPPAVYLPRRLGRGQPPEPDRRVPGPRPLRPDLLQPGHDVGRRHSAGRRRHGLLHGRRSVRARHVGRVDHRQGSGHDLSRRSAARQGGDRRDRVGRGAGRRRRPYARVRRRRPFRARRPSRARHRPPDRRQSQSRKAGRGRCARGGSAAVRPRRRSTASSAPTSRSPTTCAR